MVASGRGISDISKKQFQNMKHQVIHLPTLLKLAMWKALTVNLVDSKAVGWQFWGFIQACMDDQVDE